MYEERSGVTPEFPIVDFSGGGRDIAMLFGFAAGGQAHMMHPDLEFERIPSATDTPYKKEYMIPGIQAALDDDCDIGEGTTYSLSVNQGSGDGDFEANTSITITADIAPIGKEFDKWTGDVQYLANPNNTTTTVTMPAANITVTATYKDIGSNVKKDNFLTIASWEAGFDTLGSSVSIDSSQKADTILNTSISVVTSDEANKKWAWAQISGYASGDFSNVSSVELTYSSDNVINLILDQDGLSAGGASYYYELPPANNSHVVISIDDFKQPSWVKTDAPDLVAELKLSEVGSISFAAVKEKATTNLEINGIYLEGYLETPITDNNSMILPIDLVKVSLLESNRLILSNVKMGVYNISIFNLLGKSLFSLKRNLNGNNVIDFGNRHLTKGSYIIKISNGSSAYISNRILN